jgi:hypothetical protein
MYTNVIVALDVENQPPDSSIVEAERPFVLARQPLIAQVYYYLNSEQVTEYTIYI